MANSERTPRRRHIPTVRSRRLAAELRRLRLDADLTVDQVAEALRARVNEEGIKGARWSTSKVSRLENDKQGMMAADLRLLLDLYEVGDDDRTALETLARNPNRREWWHRYGKNLPESFQMFVSLEAEAASMRNFETELVPGLLQTPAYAQAVIRAGRPTLSESEVEKRVRIRTTRQRVLRGDCPLELWGIIGEAALRRPVGGPDVMREQLQQLVELNSLPNVTVQVLPFSAGAYPAMGTSFTVLGFPGTPALGTVYIENGTSCTYQENEEDVAAYSLVFDHLRAAALTDDASMTLINDLVRESG